MNFIKGNWVDLVILIILGYFVSEAWRLGFWVIIADFLGFLLSILVSLWGYQYVSTLLQANFNLPRSVSNALGFLGVAGFAEGFFGYIFFKLVKKIPYKLWKKPWSRLAAIIPSLGQGIIIISFVLTLIIGLPISPQIKGDIDNSRIGGYLIAKTSNIEAKLNEIFGGLVEDSLTYLTVKPGSRESIPINIQNQKLVVDSYAEGEMYKMVIEERAKSGVGQLKLSPEITNVARAYALELWEKHYFGHISPEGEDVGARLDKAQVKYTLAGENLALAPTVQIAMTGLMNSEGHRANILDPEFKRVGIGVVDNGIYGKMFVQVFTD